MRPMGVWSTSTTSLRRSTPVKEVKNTGGVGTVALAERASHGPVKHFVDQGGLARTGDAGDGDQHAERNFDIEAMEVVGAGSAKNQPFPARLAAARGHRNGNLPGKIAPGDGVGIGLDFGHRSLGQQLAAKLARSGAQIEKMIGRREECRHRARPQEWCCPGRGALSRWRSGAPCRAYGGRLKARRARRAHQPIATPSDEAS